MCYKGSYKKNLKKFPVLKQNKKLCTYAQKKSLHICKVFGKKKSFFRNFFFFATGLIFERFLAPRSRFFEKVNGLGVLGTKDINSSHIPSMNQTKENATKTLIRTKEPTWLLLLAVSKTGRKTILPLEQLIPKLLSLFAKQPRVLLFFLL
ncbi:hypothetical protein LXL04_002504 [Taraxacum kok-saghyz]